MTDPVSITVPSGEFPEPEIIASDVEVIETFEEEPEIVAAPAVRPALRRRGDGLLERHRFILGLALLVVVLAPLLEVVNGQERIAFRWWSTQALPETCYAKKLIPAGCPGCGLTRSTVYLFQGRIRESWDMHRLGPLIVLVILLQIPYRLYAIYGPSPTPFGERIPRALGYGLAALLLTHWGWRIIAEWN